MYLHCRHGFVEADAWDGQPLPPVAEHHNELLAQLAAAGGTIVVVRARRFDTLAQLVAGLPRTHAGGVLPQLEIHESPLGWDYEWRCYLTALEWGMCMTAVAMGLDYRNFKHTAQHGEQIDRREYKLALAIWGAAYREVERPMPTPSSPVMRERLDRMSWDAHDPDPEADVPDGLEPDYSRTELTDTGYSAPLVPTIRRRR